MLRLGVGRPGAGLLLLQLEIPPETVLAAARAGREAGALVVLNAAPARELPVGLLAEVDVLVVNAGEAAELAVGDDPGDAATRLRAQGPATVVVTLGGDGCLVAEDQGMARLPADAVEVVDTAGAGDCFAVALAVTRPGAQATPSAAEVAAFARGRDPREGPRALHGAALPVTG